jgi:hypothetical protein
MVVHDAMPYGVVLVTIRVFARVSDRKSQDPGRYTLFIIVRGYRTSVSLRSVGRTGCLTDSATRRADPVNVRFAVSNLLFKGL